MDNIKVRLKNNPYNIYVGKNILGKTGTLLRTKVSGKKVLLVSNKKVYGYYGKKLRAGLARFFNVRVCLLPDGEKYKTTKTVEKIYASCLKHGMDRYSTIVALGGGVVGDMAGFAAATYMRGINLVHVPTTVVAQVDSSIGGKTGVDLPFGKNLVGAFYQPLFVVADILTLGTLNPEEYKNGLAEAIKHGIIMDVEYFNFLRDKRKNILLRDPGYVLKLVKGSIRLKAGIVEKDEKEKSGIRAVLNYGHTIGHAIEAATGFKGYKHGQAVVLGMAAAASMAYGMGICSKAVINQQLQVFNEYNLIKPLKNIKINNILKRLYADKKVKNGKIRFILTKKIGCVSFIESVRITTVKNYLQRLKRYSKNKEEVLYG